MTTPARTKVYEEVLKELQLFIRNKQLGPGDKLPSEGELADQLSAGRSSIREALRAMELLGLIETRHGEGTYLRAYRSYRTVELLSTFILNEPNTKEGIVVTKKVLEKEAAKLAFGRLENVAIDELIAVATNKQLTSNTKHVQFFSIIFNRAENNLLEKIWRLLEDFSSTVNTISYDGQFYERIIYHYKHGNYKEIEDVFDCYYN